MTVIYYNCLWLCSHIFFREEIMAEVNARKRGNYWQYYFEGVRVEGKRKRVVKSGFKTKKEALEAGNRALAEYNECGQTLVANKDTSIIDFVQDKYYDYIDMKYRDRTAKDFKRSLDLFISWYGSYNITKFTYINAEDYLSKLIKRGLAKNTIQTYISCTKRMFELAVKLNVIKKNPMFDIKVPETTENEGNPHVIYSDSEVKRYLEAYKGTPLETAIMIAYHCGLRVSEMCALTWDDINFKKKKLTINKQLVSKDRTFYFAPCKYSSSRVIDLDDEIVKYLKKLKAEKESVIYRYSYTVNPDRSISCGTDFSFVVSRDDSKVISSDNIHTRLSYHRLGKDPLKMHSLRHTHCTKLITAGFDLKYVQQRLGHRSVKTTLDIYSHLTDDVIEESRAKLSDLFD